MIETGEKINISNVWGKIPINEIKQNNCEACVFGHYASICGETGYSDGVKECLKMLQAKHKGANLAHLLVILKSCGADKDPWGGVEWENYPETFKKLEKAFKEDLPSLKGADLREADFYKANLYGADLYDVDLSEAELREADLRGTVLYKANLIEANLIEANLIRADLSGAILRLADLRWADLSGADLSGTDLRLTDLRGADLSLTDLRGADLSETDLSETYLVGAKYNSKTIFLEGFSPEKEHMIRF